MRLLKSAAAAVVLATLLTSCDNNGARGPFSLRLQPGVIEVATCATLAINQIDVDIRVKGSPNWRNVVRYDGRHRFQPGDTFTLGQPVDGMDVVKNQPISAKDLTELSVRMFTAPDTPVQGGFVFPSGAETEWGHWLNTRPQVTAEPCSKNY